MHGRHGIMAVTLWGPADSLKKTLIDQLNKPSLVGCIACFHCTLSRRRCDFKLFDRLSFKTYRCVMKISAYKTSVFAKTEVPHHCPYAGNEICGV